MAILIENSALPNTFVSLPTALLERRYAGPTTSISLPHNARLRPHKLPLAPINQPTTRRNDSRPLNTLNDSYTNTTKVHSTKLQHTTLILTVDICP